MAAIDKTYTNSYQEYKEFKDWATTQTVTFFDGYKECVGDYVRNLEEKDFEYGEIPIMNTPTWLDIYLIQNCKFDFVLDRFIEVYGVDSYNEFKTVDLTSKPPKEFKQNRKIIISKYKPTSFPLHSKPYGGRKWRLECDDFHFWYNSQTKKWIDCRNYYPYTTNAAYITSIKALVRHLRKQYLPKGIKFILSGRYIGEDYLVTVK